jgi:membrane associated rhomboid family serine protease
MLYDRPYMRSNSGRREISVLGWIIIGTIAVFVLQNIVDNLTPGRGSFMLNWFALSTPGVQSGLFWTFLTYGFLHGNLFHILVNLLGIYFLGRELVAMLGSGRFLGFYFSAVLLGGLLWFITSVATGGGMVVGASAALFGMLTLFASFYPERPITLLLFFVIPVTVKPKHLAMAALAISLFGLIFIEIPGTGGVAHSAHLGGMLAGWGFFRFLHSVGPVRRESRVSMEMPSWLRKRRSGTTSVARNYKVNIRTQEDIRAEVDRILDKINSQGFGSLTEAEKKLLDDAREMLSRR